jgi:hypothetical protein
MWVMHENRIGFLVFSFYYNVRISTFTFTMRVLRLLWGSTQFYNNEEQF